MFNQLLYFVIMPCPTLKKTHAGRIVAISSVGGKAAIPYNTPYCASKYAMHGFYDSLRMELAQHSVSCTVVYPWWVATEFHEAQLTKDGVPRGSRGRAYYTKKTMTSDQCAQIVLNASYKRRREVLMWTRHTGDLAQSDRTRIIRLVCSENIFSRCHSPRESWEDRGVVMMIEN